MESEIREPAGLKSEVLIELREKPKHLIIELVIITLLGLFVILLRELGWWLAGLPRKYSATDALVLAAIFLCAYILRYASARSARKDSAHKVTLTESGIQIERRNGQSRAFDWQDVEKIGCDEHNTLWMFQVKGQRIKLSSEGLDLGSGWDNLSTEICLRIPEIVEFEDLSESFNVGLCRWLDRLAPPTLIFGLLITAWSIARGQKVAAVLVGGVALTLLIIYAELYHRFGFREIESRWLNFLARFRFYGIKAIAIIPLTLIYCCIYWPFKESQRPAVKEEGLYSISNIMFFGGMACALIIGQGLSFSQYKQWAFKGLNKYRKAIVIFSLIICAAGFILKCWNES
jgi:hypothetical protein